MAPQHETPNKQELLARMDAGWRDFNTYLDSLSEVDLTRKTDAAGWTGKDHVMHLAVWEGSAWALLEKMSRHEYLGLDHATLLSGDFDHMNAIIQQQHREKPLAEVRQYFQDVHEQLRDKVDSLSEADLLRPYQDYQPDTPWTRPVIDWVIMDSYTHYAKHQPWITAIVAGED